MINLSSQKVLITGSSGFLGYPLVKNLEKLGVQIIDVPRKSTDLTNFNQVQKLKPKIKNITFLIHLAASIPKNNDKNFFLDNLILTQNLIKILPSKISGIIFASTVDVYGQPRKSRIDETHPTHPDDFYGLSKLYCEEFLKLYCQKNNIPLTILRFSQIYGPHEKPYKAIPIFSSRLKRGLPLEIYGDGQDIRDYLYLEDALEAIILALKKNRTGIYNIGTGQGTKIIEVAKLLIKISKLKEKIVFKSRKVAKTKIIFDIKKARKYLGYSPQYSLKEGLLQTWQNHENIY